MNAVSWIFVATGILALILSAMSGSSKLGTALTLLVLGAGCGVVSFLLRRRAQHSLIDVSADEFLRRLRPFTKAPDVLLLAERKHVSRVLGVASEKLDPRQNLDDLSRHLNFVGSFSVAINDLRYEVEELYEDSALELPEEATTVGDLITQLALAKHRVKAAASA
jgi:hypothetical protein